MDESLQELEAELKRLAPRRPSAGLHARLAAELAAAPVRSAPRATATSFTSWKWSGWKLAAALGLGTLIGLLLPERASSPATPAPDLLAAAGPMPEAMPAPAATDAPVQAARAFPAAPSERYRPVAAANVLYDLKDEGTVQLDDQTTARRLRYRYVDSYTWKNPASNASVRWSVPREEVRIVPVRWN